MFNIIFTNSLFYKTLLYHLIKDYDRQLLLRK